MMAFTTDELIREAQRELRQREHVYPRLIGQGRLTQKQADRQMALQREIIDRLRELDAGERLI